MSLRDALRQTATLVVVLVLLALLAGQLLGYPILLGYVETGSMSPTLEPGDGFIAIPSAVAGDVETGDVVVFRAQELDGGGLITHRVVGETERGYLTRGDANPFADQDGAEPPVRDVQIVAEALQVGGRVVVVPRLGTAVTAVSDGLQEGQRTLAVALGTSAVLGPAGLGYLLFGLAVVVYVVGALRDAGFDRRPARDRRRDDGASPRLVVFLLALMIVTAATASMVVPAGTQEFEFVSSESGSESPTVIEQGTSEELTYGVPNLGLVPMHVYLEPASDGVAADSEYVYVDRRSRVNATVTLTAPPSTGYYREYLVEWRYLAVLPKPVVDDLRAIHPWTPILVIDALLGVPFYAVGTALLRGGYVRTREPKRRPKSGRVEKFLDALR